MIIWILKSFQLFHATSETPITNGQQQDTIHVFGQININDSLNFSTSHLRGFQNAVLNVTGNLDINLKSIANLEIVTNGNFPTLPDQVLMYNVTFTNLKLNNASLIQEFFQKNIIDNVIFKNLTLMQGNSQYLFSLDSDRTPNSISIYDSNIVIPRLFTSTNTNKSVSNIVIQNSTLNIFEFANISISSNVILTDNIINNQDQLLQKIFLSNRGVMANNIYMHNNTFNNFYIIFNDININNSIFQDIQINNNENVSSLQFVNYSMIITNTQIINVNLISNTSKKYAIITIVQNMTDVTIKDILILQDKYVSFSVIQQTLDGSMCYLERVSILNISVSINANIEPGTFINIINQTSNTSIINSTFNINISSQILNEQVVANENVYINGFAGSMQNTILINPKLTSSLSIFNHEQNQKFSGVANTMVNTVIQNIQQNLQLYVSGTENIYVFANKVETNNSTAITGQINVYPIFYLQNSAQLFNVFDVTNIKFQDNFISNIFTNLSCTTRNDNFSKIECNPIIKTKISDRLSVPGSNNIRQLQNLFLLHRENKKTHYLLSQFAIQQEQQNDQGVTINKNTNNIITKPISVAELNTILQQYDVNMLGQTLTICPQCFELKSGNLDCQMSDYCMQNQSSKYLVIENETRAAQVQCQDAQANNVQWCTTAGPICKSGFSGSTCSALVQPPIATQPFFWLFLILLIAVIILIVIICLLMGCCKCCGCCGCACCEKYQTERTLITTKRQYSNNTPFLSEQAIQSPLDNQFYLQNRLRQRPQTDLGMLQERSVKVASSIGWQQQQILESKLKLTEQKFDPLNKFRRTGSQLKPISQVQYSKKNFLQQNQSSKEEEQIKEYTTVKTTHQENGRLSKLTNRSSMNGSTVSTEGSQVVQNIQNIIVAPAPKPRQITYQLENFSDSEPDSTFHPEQDSKWRLTEQQMTIRGDEVKRIYDGEELFSDSNLIEIMNRRRHQHADSQVTQGSTLFQASTKDIIDT